MGEQEVWPSSWRSLAWLPLIGAAAVTVARWGWDRVVYQFDPHRRYPR